MYLPHHLSLHVVRGRCTRCMLTNKESYTRKLRITNTNTFISTDADKLQKAVSRHLGFYRNAISAIRSADPENSSIESNIKWIGCTLCEIFAFKLYCDVETAVRGHSRSSKAALFDRAHTTLYSSSMVTMPLPSTLSEI